MNTINISFPSIPTPRRSKSAPELSVETLRDLKSVKVSSCMQSFRETVGTDHPKRESEPPLTSKKIVRTNSFLTTSDHVVPLEESDDSVTEEYVEEEENNFIPKIIILAKEYLIPLMPDKSDKIWSDNLLSYMNDAELEELSQLELCSKSTTEKISTPMDVDSDLSSDFLDALPSFSLNDIPKRKVSFRSFSQVKTYVKPPKIIHDLASGVFTSNKSEWLIRFERHVSPVTCDNRLTYLTTNIQEWVGFYLPIYSDQYEAQLIDAKDLMKKFAADFLYGRHSESVDKMWAEDMTDLLSQATKVRAAKDIYHRPLLYNRSYVSLRAKAYAVLGEDFKNLKRLIRLLIMDEYIKTIVGDSLITEAHIRVMHKFMTPKGDQRIYPILNCIKENFFNWCNFVVGKPYISFFKKKHTVQLLEYINKIGFRI